MKSLFHRYGYLTAATVLVFASASFAQVNMQLTGANGAIEGGVYTDPYYGTVNGVPAAIICDDYADDSYFWETWKANATNETQAGTSSAVKWNAGSSTATQQLYNELSYLATQMLAAAPGQAQEDYSFALWELACTGTTANIGGTCTPPAAPNDASIVAGYITAAQGQKNTLYADVTIYTPISDTQGTCGSSPCPNQPPQEFLVVPEPSTIALLGVDLLGLLALAFFYRRRGFQLAG